VLTSIGHVTVGRRYFACPSCGGKQRPWNDWAGLRDGTSLTPHARRMATLAGTSWPFDRAEAHLLEFCHVRVSDDTIERVCQAEGQRAKRWMQESNEPVKAFERAGGLPEFSSDGLKINTVGGWREMRLSVLAKREPTTPCEPQDWDTRVLNEPTARLASCMIANCNRVGASWQHLGTRAGLRDSSDLSVIADGARWIWDQAARRLSKRAAWCVDVYHVSQRLHDCGKAIFGEGSAAAKNWAQDRLMHALQHNGVGLIDRLANERTSVRAPNHRRAMDRLLNYLADNRDSLWYRDRLRDGLPIGSGLIEGGCKNTIGARLKANSARWRVRRAERIGALRCLNYSGQWEAYWQSNAA
jgi:hypothetical protein